MRDFLWGALATSALIASMFFLRFWTQTRDRLFALFAAAFLVFALNWVLLAVYPHDESRHYAFFVRLIAFLLIIAAIVDKNRRPT